jgi:hypothetical protein
MTCNFQVGQKVVCVEHACDLDSPSDGLSVPQYGVIYTVRQVLMEEGEVWLLLDEIRNEPDVFIDGSGEPCFHHEGFRPVVERGTETGMSILRNLLNKTGKPVEVDA